MTPDFRLKFDLDISVSINTCLMRLTEKSTMVFELLLFFCSKILTNIKLHVLREKSLWSVACLQMLTVILTLACSSYFVTFANWDETPRSSKLGVIELSGKTADSSR